MSPDAVLGELEGLRALARSLVHGDAEADDLLQQTAISAIAHPPADATQPMRPWLAAVLRNHWRMDRRATSRRLARELAVPAPIAAPGADDLLDRARTLERLANALVALDEPLRTVVIRRYLDGQSAADIARALGIPAATVRWRLKTGLERLRAALDDTAPRWQRALLPLVGVKGAVVVKTKTTVISLVMLLLLLVTGAIVWVAGRGDDRAGTAQTSPPGAPLANKRAGAAGIRVMNVDDAGVAAVDPAPGQRRARVERVAAPGGVLSGRVINWSTGDGVANAELTFTSDAGATTVRSNATGAFELTPPTPGPYSLSVAVAAGFLPFAPELMHSSVRAELVKDRAVRDVTVFLFPALDYAGQVVDGAGNPVAGAKVRIVGTPQGEQAIEKLATEWTTDKQGAFSFHAADGAVLEAVRGGKRGWSRLTGAVQTTHRMTITIGDAPARDASIRGKVIDSRNAPLAEVLVRAIPDGPPGPDHTRAEAYALSDPDGTFVLDGLDRGNYRLVAELDDYAPLERGPIAGGSRDVTLTLDAGLLITGRVETADGEPVPAYSLLVLRREQLMRALVVDRSVLDPRGEFSVRVPRGELELLASAPGWAPAAPVTVAAGTTGVKIVLSAGATLTGIVVDAAAGTPLQYARVQREGAGGGASAQPANAGTVTRADGTFELTGIPAGPLSLSIGAGGYHPRLEAGLTATDGAVLGPIRIAMTKLADGEQPKIELVGIGVKLVADKDALRIEVVVPQSGAADAGIVAGDQLTTVDGVPVTQLGMDGAVARIRGVAGTTIAIGVRRGDQVIPVVVTRKRLQF